MPRASIAQMSPVRSQPSALKTRAVSSGLFQ
jgi:hypothetical protein